MVLNNALRLGLPLAFEISNAPCPKSTLNYLYDRDRRITNEAVRDESKLIVGVADPV